MSESTDELKTSVEGISEALAEAAALTGRMVVGSGEFVDEASRRGWHGMASRLQDACDALEIAAEKLQVAANSTAAAAIALGQITQDVPLSGVATHLSTSTTDLTDADTALQEALERAGETQDAATEVEQEGIMQAVAGLTDQLTDVHEELIGCRARSELEQGLAQGFKGRQLGNCCRVMAHEPRHHPVAPKAPAARRRPRRPSRRPGPSGTSPSGRVLRRRTKLCARPPWKSSQR